MLFWTEPLETVDRPGARVLRHPTSIFTASLLSLFEGSLSQRSRYTKVRGSKKQSLLHNNIWGTLLQDHPQGYGQFRRLNGNIVSSLWRKSDISFSQIKTAWNNYSSAIQTFSRAIETNDQKILRGRSAARFRKVLQGLMLTERVANIAFLDWHAGLPIFNTQTKQVLNLNIRVLNISVEFTFGCPIPNAAIHFLVEFKLVIIWTFAVRRGIRAKIYP